MDDAQCELLGWVVAAAADGEPRVEAGADALNAHLSAACRWA